MNTPCASQLSTSDLLSEATQFGEKNFSPSSSKYVCHTSTIPLATTVDPKFFYETTVSETVSHWHGGSVEHPPCPKRSCLCINSLGQYKTLRIHSNCPCRDVGNLHPICFLVYLKSLARNITPVLDEDMTHFRKINPKEIMFCFDAQCILDESYGAVLRSVANCSGYSHLRERNLIPLLRTLYWFRKFGPKYEIEKLIKKAFDKNSIHRVMQSVKQCLHTLNGMLMKKFFGFGPEIVGYKVIAEQTARCFRDLFIEYNLIEHEPFPKFMPNGFFSDYKKFSNHVKRCFALPTFEGRRSVFDYDFESPSLKAFYKTELQRLHLLVSTEAQAGRDYTDSLAWIFRNAEICQTRVLGYLPPQMAQASAMAYRSKVSRDLEPASTEELNLIMLSVERGMRNAGIPRGFLLGTQDIELEQIRSVLSEIKMDVTLSSSVDTKFSDAGKLEDARILFNKIRDNRWIIPIRDLNDFSIVEMLPPLERSYKDDEVDLSRYLFWTSLQICLNFLIERGLEDEEFYYELLEGDDDYRVDVLDCAILHINEPGKLRDLVKSKSVLSWTLSVGAKILQAVLAMIPEHTCGLKASAHDWSHSIRMSCSSSESGFMFEPITKKLAGDVRQVYKDWQEATDFIGKRKGIATLKGVMNHISFPEKYGSLIMKLMREPQRAVEVSMLSYLDGDEPTVINNSWRGFINEGFMMGLQVTKVVLHAIHLSESAISKHFLLKRGIKFRPAPRFGTYQTDKAVNIPRDWEDGVL